ncbi:MAG: response regulator transcription factor [Akkermansiaceae bacterium]|jgi:DNA-binding NarL/FixJ family response regulator|nr:response regulator transcription factor [Akkermansiaceae bacterium]
MNDLPENITVWLVEDNEIYRCGLSRAIESADGMFCPEAFADAESALSAVDTGMIPDVILLDVGLPGIDGLTALKRFAKIAPEIRIVLLTVFNDTDKIFKAVCAGANGYLLKTSSTDQVLNAVRQAAAGGAPMDPQVADRVLTLFNQLAEAKSPPPPDYGLSPREKQILEQMAQGLVNKEIADVLGISPHTVINHLRSIYTKLHVNTNTGAVAKAIREGLV